MLPDWELPDADDIRILENETHRTLKEGCKECGFLQVVFQSCISVENECKVFFLSIECPKCLAEYKDIMTIKPMRKDYDNKSIYK